MKMLLTSGATAKATKVVCGTTNPSALVVVATKKNFVASSPKQETKEFLICNPAFCVASSKKILSLSLQSYRFTHTDVRFPDFMNRRSTTDPEKTAKATEDVRRTLRHGIMYGIGGAAYLIMATKLIQAVVYFKSMPADQIALGTIQINLNEIPEGQCKTYEWRGKPLFVKHRTADEIEQARNVKMSELRDPQEDSSRVQRPEWLIMLGVCPHLGCVPIHGKGEYNAWFCPCHSSSFDMSGRIRIGPAPSNLEVPPYKFHGNDVVVVGEE